MVKPFLTEETQKRSSAVLNTMRLPW